MLFEMLAGLWIPGMLFFLLVALDLGLIQCALQWAPNNLTSPMDSRSMTKVLRCTEALPQCIASEGLSCSQVSACTINEGHLPSWQRRVQPKFGLQVTQNWPSWQGMPAVL